MKLKQSNGLNGIRTWNKGKGDDKMQKMRKRNNVYQNKKGKTDARRTGTGYNHAC